MGHRPVAGTRRVALLLVAAGAVALAAPSLAAATTRFAAPGGTAPDTMCTTPATPCNIATAAAGPDVTPADTAVIEPGHYSNTAGDLGALVDAVAPKAGIVRGEAGDPRPLITLDGDSPVSAFFISSGNHLSHLEIDADNVLNAITIAGGQADDLIVRTRGANNTACNLLASTPVVLSNSACLTTGLASIAVGTAANNVTGTREVTLRNVTAVSSAEVSAGLAFIASATSPNAHFDVVAENVIARGPLTDVIAGGHSGTPGIPNTGAHTSITLDHSNYATIQDNTDEGGGSAMITQPGFGTNQTDAPLLAADGFHERAGSPTIDKGAMDPAVGTTDIDGQSRTIGPLPDIGADEHAFPTTTAVNCTPNPLVLGSGRAHCRVTVADTTSPPPVTFGAGVRLSSALPGTIDSRCELLGSTTSGQVSCSFDFTPQLAGAQSVTAMFPGDATHDPSQDTDLLQVTQPVVPPGSQSPAMVGRKKCKKTKKHKRSASAAKKKKCKKKRR
jgi:hypothetical protein